MTEEKNYISLQEATKYCDYSQEYLSLRARQGKLKAVKFGRNWVTKEEWVKEYFAKTDEYNNSLNDKKFAKFIAPPKNLPIEKRGFKITEPRIVKKIRKAFISYRDFMTLKPALSFALVFVLFTASIAYGKEPFKSVFKEATSLALEFNENFDRGVASIASDYQTADAEILFKEYGQWILSQPVNFGKKVVEDYSDANDFVEEKLSGLADNIKKSPRDLVEGYQVANDFVEEKLKQGYEAVGGFFAKTYNFITSPWGKTSPLAEEETKQEESANIQEESGQQAGEGIITTETTKEVTKITQIEPIKEITKEIITIDQASIIQLKALQAKVDTQASQISNLQLEIARRSTGLIAPSYSIQPVTQVSNTPRLYAENDTISIIAAGTGNIHLSATNDISAYSERFNITGNLIVTGTQTYTGPVSITASSTSPALTVRQNGTGNIVEFKDGTNSVFTITDGGYATFAAYASTTPSVLIRSPDVTWTSASSTYFAIVGTSTFEGRFIDIQKDGTSLFYIDGSGNTVIGGTLSVTTSTSRVTGDLTISGNVGIGTTTPATTLGVYGTSTFMGGYIGVGTTTPSTKLDVYGNINALSMNLNGSPVQLAADYFTKLLFHFDGTDTATTFVDNSAVSNQVTAFGTAQLDTAQKKFGTASLLLDGDSDYLTLPDSDDWDTTGNFTVDFWVRFAALPTDGNKMVVIGQYVDPSHWWKIDLLNSGGIYYWRFDNDYVTELIARSGAATIIINTWYHVAIYRNTNTIYFFQNGSSLDSSTQAFTTNTLDGNLYIGQKGGGAQYLNGWIDELRFSKDIIRWASDFTVPTSPYANSSAFGISSSGAAYYFGNVGIGTTTPASTLGVYGTTTIMNGYLGVGTTTPNQALTVYGNIAGSGNTVLTGTLQAATTTIFGNVLVQGNIMPYDAAGTYYVGTGAPEIRWDYGYFGEINALNITAASTSISGTVAETFTINSDATSNQNAYLEFYRGGATTSASMAWASTTNRFEFNFPIHLSGTGQISSASSLNFVSGAASTWTTNGLTINSTGDIKATTTENIIFSLGDTAGGKKLYITDSTGATSTAILTVTSDGKLGVGTTTPYSTLGIYGTSTFMGGYVGIGTTSPGALLDVIGGDARVRRTDGTSAQLTIDTNGTGASSILYLRSVLATSTASIWFNGNLEFSDGNPTNPLMIISRDGKVGIGTSTPTSTFGVYGTSTFMGGYVGIGTTTPAYTFSVVGNVYGSGNAIFGQNLSVSGTSSFVGTSTFWGNVGIGTTTPATTLGVYGTSTFMGGYVGIGTTTPNSFLQIYGSTASTTLTVTQAGTGNILDIKDSGTSIFTISDGGYASLAVNASTTPSFLIKSLGFSPTFSTSTYLGIGATSTFVGNFAEFLLDATTTFKVDQSGNLYVNGAMKNVATKIVAATSSQNYAFRADYVCAGASCEDEIQSAINALPADGGVVYLLEGTYVMSTSTYSDCSIKMSTSTSLIGSGASTILQIKNSFNAALKVICNSDTSVGNSRILISNLKLDGNKANNSAGNQYGIYFTKVGSGNGSTALPGAKIQNILVENFRTHGISLYSSSTNNTVTGNTMQGNNSDGIMLYQSSYNTITGNTIQGNSYTGFYLYSSSYNTITGNLVQGNSNYGIDIYSSSAYNTVTGNTIQGNASIGIDLYSSSNNTITGNKIHNNGGNDSGDGININSNSDANLISSNDITDTTGSGYAINIADSNCDNNYLVGNRYSGTGASAISDSGTNTSYGSQLFGSSLLSTSTAANLIIKPSGYVGIGTTTPATVLTVYGSTTIMNGYLGVGTTTPATTLGVYGTSTFMGGNVGIGTTTPALPLQVVGSADGAVLVTGPSQNIYFNAVTGTGRSYIGYAPPNFNIWNVNNGYIAFGTNNTEQVRLTETGYLGVGTTTPATTLGVYGTSTFMGGNVGIGTTTPSDKLHVAGFIRTDNVDWALSNDFGANVNYVLSQSVYNGKLYAGLGDFENSGSVYVYNGSTWTLNNDFGASFKYVFSLATYNGKLYAGLGNAAGDGGKVYVYDGSTWSLNNNFGTDNVPSLAVYNGKLYAGLGSSDGEGDIYSYDGSSWTLSNDFGATINYVISLAAYNGKLYAGLGNGSNEGDVYSFDGSTWSLSNDFGAGFSIVRSLTVYNGKLYAGLGSGDGDIYVYDGSTWSLNNNFGASVSDIYSLVAYNGKLYAGLGASDDNGDVYAYDGSTWSLSYSFGTTINIVQSLAVYNGKLFAGLGNADGEGDIYVYSERLESQLSKEFNAYTTPLGEQYQNFTKDLSIITSSARSTSSVLTVTQSGTGYGALITGGYVGIGTSTPATTFGVYGTTTLMSGYLGVGTTTPAATLGVYGTSTFSGGYVGIGTSTPGYNLSVVGNIYGSGNAIFGGTLAVSSTSTFATSGGYAGIGTTTPASILGVYGTSTFMGGNVGIGTTTPAAKLVVLGNSIFQPTASGNTVIINDQNGYVQFSFDTSNATLCIGSSCTNNGTIKGGYNLTLQSRDDNFGAVSIKAGTDATTGINFLIGGVEKMRINSSGNVGIGTTTPAALLDIYASSTSAILSITQSGTGNIANFIAGSTSIFTLKSSEQLKLRTGLVQTWGAFNDKIVDDFEDNDVTNWTSSDTSNSPVTATTTYIKVNDYAMTLKATVGGSNNDTATSSVSSEDWSTLYSRLGFWIKADYKSTSTAATTTQIISVMFHDTGVITSSSTVTISKMSEWQYQEWDISGITATSRDAVDWMGFRIDNDYGSPTFYIDQIRLYAANLQAGEMFVDGEGNFAIWGQKSVEIGRTSASGGSLPSIKTGSGVIEFNQPISVNVGGDVGFDYDIQFTNTGLSQITSEGALSILAGDPNHAENLTLGTQGTGDVIIDIIDANLAYGGFKALGSDSGGYIMWLSPAGDLYVGGNGSGGSDLTVKQNITLTGGNITIGKLASTTVPTLATTTSGFCTAATYFYRITAANDNGQTLGSATTSTTTSAGNTDSVIVSWDGVSGATKHYVWRSTDTNWGDNDDYRMEVSAPTVVYTDTCTTTQATSTFPTVNTTGGNLTAWGNMVPGTTTATSSSYNLGAVGSVWSNLYVVTSNVGDIVFGNQFRITEAMATSSPEKLIFQNASSTPILTIDQNGVLEVGKILAKSARLQKLEMIDQATGLIWCTWIESGEWMKLEGECIEATSTEESATTSESATSTEPQPAGTPDSGGSPAPSGEETPTSTEPVATTTEPVATSTESCVPNWSCTEWGADSYSTNCGENYAQTRTCTDLNNCGATEGKPAEEQPAAGTKCEAQNASGVCQISTCSFTCAEGFSDCDSDMTNGCEFQLETATSTCLIP